MKKVFVLLLILIFGASRESVSQVPQVPQVYFNGQGTGGFSLNIYSSASSSGTVLTTLSISSKICAEALVTNSSDAYFTNWIKVCLPSTSGSITYGYMPCNEFYARINTINNYATVTATSLNIRTGAGTSYSNVTISGTNATFGNNSVVALTGASTNVSGVMWYEVYLPNNCSQQTGYVSSGTGSVFLSINSPTSNYSIVGGRVCENPSDCNYLGTIKNATATIGSLGSTYSSSGYYQYKVPKNWSGSITCSHPNYTTSTPASYSVYASTHTYNLNFVLSNSSAQYGSVKVTLSPSGSVSAGAQWCLDGSNNWQNSGATLSNVSVGSHTIDFNTISGWVSPSSQSINVTNGNLTTASGTYTVSGSQYGSVNVVLSPSGAVSAGAQWSLDNSTWHNSGYTQSNVATGNQTLYFKTIAGYTAPSSKTITVTTNQTTNETGVYVPGSGSSSITGIVKDASVNENTGSIDFNPLANCVVNIYVAGTTTTAQTAYTTTSSGAFSFTGLVSGNYDIKVEEYVGSQTLTVKANNISAGTSMGDIIITKTLNNQIKSKINGLQSLACFVTQISESLDVKDYNMSQIQNILEQWYVQTGNYDKILNSTGRLFLATKALNKYYYNATVMNDEIATNILILGESLFDLLTISAKLQKLAKEALIPFGYEFMEEMIDNTIDVFQSMALNATSLLPYPYGQEFNKAMQEAFWITRGQIDPFDFVVSLVEKPVVMATTRHYLDEDYVTETQSLVSDIATHTANFSYPSNSTFNQAYNLVDTKITNCDNFTYGSVQDCEYHRTLANYASLGSKLSLTVGLFLDATGVGVLLGTALTELSGPLQTASFAEISWSTYSALYGIYKIQADLTNATDKAFYKTNTFNSIDSASFGTAVQNLNVAILNYNFQVQEFINAVNSKQHNLAMQKAVSIIKLDSTLHVLNQECLFRINSATVLADSLLSGFSNQYFDGFVNNFSIVPANKLAFYHCIAAYMIDSNNTSNLAFYANALINSNLKIQDELKNMYTIISPLPSPGYVASTYNGVPKFLGVSKSGSGSVKFKNYGSTNVSDLYVKVEVNNGYTVDIDSFYIGNLGVNSSDSISFNITSPSLDTSCVYTITFNSATASANPLVGTILSSKNIYSGVSRIPGNDNAGFSVYPNPSQGHFRIKFNTKSNPGPFQIEVYNQIGERVYNSTGKVVANNFTKDIALQGANSGIYYVKVTTGTSTATQKILVK